MKPVALNHFDETMRLLAEHPTDECVLWPFSLTGRGYGQLASYPMPDTGERKRRDVHALSCLLAHGPKPFPDAVAAHSCRQRSCFNPRHLRWATQSENMADRLRDGTDHRGQKHPQARLTNADIPVIRERIERGDQLAQIARDYGVGRTTIFNISAGISWASIPA